MHPKCCRILDHQQYCPNLGCLEIRCQWPDAVERDVFEQENSLTNHVKSLALVVMCAVEKVVANDFRNQSY